MPDRVKCFVCLGKDSDLLADYDVCCNTCGAGCGDALDAAWDTIEGLEEELTQARAELARERGWRRALASTAMCEAYCATSAGPGRECDCGMEHVLDEIQAAERAIPTTNEAPTREELIDD